MATRNEQTGRIGEKLVEIELLKRNINFWSMADDNPFFDLIIDTKNGLKKVQIKTSNLNKKGKFQFYLKNCVNEYDYLILVGLHDKKFVKKDFWIIPEDVLFNMHIKEGNYQPQTGINITAKKGEKYSKFKKDWSIFL